MKNKKYMTTEEVKIYLLRKHPEDLKQHIGMALNQYQKDMTEDALIADLALAIKSKRWLSKRKTKYYLRRLNRISSGKDVLRFSTFVKIIKSLGMCLTLVPVNEFWIYKNPRVLNKIRKGLKSAIHGDISRV